MKASTLFYLAAICFFAASLCSCSSVHRLTTRIREKTDTTIVKHTDSVSTKDSTVKTDTLSLDSASITVVLDSTQHCCDTPRLTNPQAQMIHDLVKAVSGKQIVKSVTISIHGLKKAAAVTSVSTATVVHKVDSVHAARDVVTVIKDVHRTNYIVFVIIISIILLILLIILYLRGKLSFITKLF